MKFFTTPSFTSTAPHSRFAGMLTVAITAVVGMCSPALLFGQMAEPWFGIAETPISSAAQDRAVEIKGTVSKTDPITTYYQDLVERIGTVNHVSNSGKGKDHAETPLTCTCSGNLLQNESFENGTTGWSWSGGNFMTGTYAAQCGSYSGQLEATSTNARVWQDKT
ncbi:MAG: hypothetical protein ABIO24_06780, partial [Saprospiraceae bacterium]